MDVAGLVADRLLQDAIDQVDDRAVAGHFIDRRVIVRQAGFDQFDIVAGRQPLHDVADAVTGRFGVLPERGLDVFAARQRHTHLKPGAELDVIEDPDVLRVRGGDGDRPLHAEDRQDLHRATEIAADDVDGQRIVGAGPDLGHRNPHLLAEDFQPGALADPVLLDDDFAQLAVGAGLQVDRLAQLRLAQHTTLDEDFADPPVPPRRRLRRAEDLEVARLDDV